MADINDIRRAAGTAYISGNERVEEMERLRARITLLEAFVAAWDALHHGDEGRHVDPPCPACAIVEEREQRVKDARAALEGKT